MLLQLPTSCCSCSYLLTHSLVTTALCYLYSNSPFPRAQHTLPPFSSSLFQREAMNMMKERSKSSLILWLSMAILVSQNLVVPVMCRSFGDEKTYYPSPDPGTPSGGHGSTPHHGHHGHSPHHGGSPSGGNCSPTTPTPSTPTPSTPIPDPTPTPSTPDYTPTPTPTTPDPSPPTTPSTPDYTPTPTTPDPSPPTTPSTPTYTPTPTTPDVTPPTPSTPDYTPTPTTPDPSPPTTPSTPTYTPSPTPDILTPPTPTIDPGTPSTPTYTPSPTTPIIDPGTLPPPTPYLPIDPGSFPGTCTYWSTHPTLIFGVLGWWGTMGSLFPSSSSFPGSSLSVPQALSNTRNDSIGALYKQGAASFLNSMSNPRFPYTTQEVQQQFVSALVSDKAASNQARLFQLANEGHVKPRA